MNFCLLKVHGTVLVMLLEQCWGSLTIKEDKERFYQYSLSSLFVVFIYSPIILWTHNFSIKQHVVKGEHLREVMWILEKRKREG